MFEEVTDNIKDLIAIFGTKMGEKSTIHVNLGKIRSLLNAATDTVYAALRETDARTERRITPTEGDYFRQRAQAECRQFSSGRIS